MYKTEHWDLHEKTPKNYYNKNHGQDKKKITL